MKTLYIDHHPDVDSLLLFIRSIDLLHITSYYITSYHAMLHHIISYHIILYHVILHHIISVISCGNPFLSSLLFSPRVFSLESISCLILWFLVALPYNILYWVILYFAIMWVKTANTDTMYHMFAQKLYKSNSYRSKGIISQ